MLRRCMDCQDSAFNVCRTKSLRDSVTESLRDTVTESLRKLVTESLREFTIESLRDSVTVSLKDQVTESLLKSTESSRSFLAPKREEVRVAIALSTSQSALVQACVLCETQCSGKSSQLCFRVLLIESS